MTLFPGFGGAVTGVAIPCLVFLLCYLAKGDGPFNLDPRGERNAFEPFLQKYLRLAEYIIGIATGSIVLLVGSSAFHGKGGHLPGFYASPLLLLAYCVVYGIGFMVWMIYHYEDYQHENPHTKLAYAISETLGFSALLCFISGYFWLIVCVAS
jgi:hypothetical protein